MTEDLYDPLLETIKKIAVQIGDLREQAFVEAVAKYANENGIDEMYLLDEQALKEILELGIRRFKEMHPRRIISLNYDGNKGGSM